VHLPKKTATVIILASIISLAFPATAMILQVEAQQTSAQNPRLQGSVPLPAGVTANITVETLIFLSFRPNPVGVGQTVLVNIWFNPPTHYNRYLAGISVETTKPDGTKDTKTNIITYGGDATAWYEFTPDQIGTWKLKCIFPGGYFPAGYIAGGWADPPQRYLDSAYYKPVSTDEQTLVVQADPVLSWPPSALPTDYWTRPVSLENREWAPILGNYPFNGNMPNPPEGTNPYASNYRYTPYVQAPNTAHIAWKRQGAIAGMLGADYGQTGLTSGGGSPSIIFQGRAYQTVTKGTTGFQSQSYWQCYDLRTGEIFWEIPLASGQSAPSMIHYDWNLPEVYGGSAGTGATPYFVSVTGGRILYYSPWTGAVSTNVTGLPSGISGSTMYSDPYVYSIQNLGGGSYRLIEWSISRTTEAIISNMVTQMGQSTNNFTARIVRNISWPFSSLGTCDFQAGIAATLSSSLYPLLGAIYGTRIQAADLKTGQLLFNITDPDTCESSSELVVDHGKVAAAMQGRHWNCYDGRTGNKLWESELTGYPWGDWWNYGVASYGGNIIGDSYDAIYAINWDTGKISWRFEAPTNPYESPYVDPNGTSVNPFFSNVVIADDKVFAYNSEHTTSQPVTRGWKLFAINARTGEGVWNITGMMSPGAMADGYITASNSYDGYMYVFGKGKSATKVTAPDTVMPKGSGVVIKGTVLDLSTAQPNTPCVSKDSMTTQMEYIHMQHPIDGVWHDATITGVPVSLTAVSSDGTYTDLGTVTTDGYYGTFSKTWTPTNEGDYKIIASFAGDESYGSSAASTSLSVGPAPTQNSNSQQQIVVPDYTMTIIGGVIAVIIAVALVGILLYRKK
jgi:PQQ-like domain